MSGSEQPKVNPPRPFPVINPTIPFWLSEPHELSDHRSSESLPETQDIVIIGSGYAGAAIAFYLYDDELPRPSITVLEARDACSGATARNGGHIRPDVHLGLPRRIKVHGQQAADEIAAFEVLNLYAVRDLVRELKIDCDFQRTTTMTVLRDDLLAGKVKAELDDLYRRGSPTAKLIHYTGGQPAETFSGVKGAKAVFSFEAASVWPYKLAMHLLSEAVAKGTNLQTGTPATSISDTPDGQGYWTITTPRGSIKSRAVIFATNGYTSALLPEYRDRIIPVRGICTRTVSQTVPPPHLPNTYSLLHQPNLYDYQITRPDGSVVVGGARTEVIPRREQWYNIVDDSALIEPAVPYFDGLMQRTYKGWESTSAKVDSIWTGIMGYTTDLHPHIGLVPSRPRQYICAGFNGHGMSFILLCAKGLARMVRDGIPFSESGVPRLFETTAARLQRSQNDILDTLADV